jgi:large conductance mechanosensitive channel
VERQAVAAQLSYGFSKGPHHGTDRLDGGKPFATKRLAGDKRGRKAVSIIHEFKEFALRGNVVDMAVGIIIGAAFSTIVKSLVDDVIMPPIGLITGGVDFSDLFIALNGESYPSLAVAREAGAPTVNYGLFFNSVISFTIVAFVLFMVIKGMNHLRRIQEEAPPEEKPAPPPREVQLLEEIRDALVKNGK